MVDEKNEYGEDEYQFADLDTLGPEISDEEKSNKSTASSEIPLGENKNIRRNILLAIGAIIFAALFYKLIWPIFSVKKPVEEIVPPPIVTPIQRPPQVQPAPIQPSVQPNPQIEQKLTALETVQQNVRSEVDSVNNQLNGISGSVNDLTNKITELNQIISNLATKVNEQADAIANLTAKAKPKPRPRVIPRKVVSRVPYYIQAIIPGRAWLIAPNGSTLTVREGSQIAGYGMVKLIDPNQGRVIMSSGEIIRFSQQDS